MDLLHTQIMDTMNKWIHTINAMDNDMDNKPIVIGLKQYQDPSNSSKVNNF